MARILVTETAPAMLRLLRAIVAHTGNEAVLLDVPGAAAEAVDVVLLDPSNAAALDWVRAHRDTDIAPPVICLLGDPGTRAAPELLPVACLHSPYGFTQVTWALEEAMRRRPPLLGRRTSTMP